MLVKMIRPIYLFGSVFCICFAMDISKYRRVIGLDGRMCVDIRFSVSSHSPTKCAVLCELDTNCGLIFVIPGNKTCIGCPLSTAFQTPANPNNAIAYGVGVRPFYIGCYIDTWDRILTGSQMPDEPSLTNKLCSQYCTDLGFIYSGTQYGLECFCGNSFDENIAPSESECHADCPGNPTQKCGGDLRLTIFTY